MLFNKDLKNKEKEEIFENENSKELTEEDYIQINKDISKALFDMKKEEDEENEKEKKSSENSDEDEKELINFDMDFFSESSNSISMDNNSDYSDNSFRSANVELNRNNLTLDLYKQLMNNSSNNNNDKKNNQNNRNNSNCLNSKQFSGNTKNSSSTSMEGYSDKQKKKSYNKKYSFKSIKNKRKLSGFYSTGDNLNNSFNSSPYLNFNNNNNLLNNRFFNNNDINQNLNNSFNFNNRVNMNNNNFNNNLNGNNINNNNKMQIIINNNMNNINNINFLKRNNENEIFMQNNNLNMNNLNNLNNINNLNNMNNLNNSLINNINNNFLNNNILNNNMNIINNNKICNNNINNMNQNYNIMMMNNKNINNLNNMNNNKNILSCSFSEGNASSFNIKNECIDSPKNIIHIENILKSKDKRTTLIIRNIPNRYTISLLLQELNQNYARKYDVVYLPQDYMNNSNLGFGFINFLEHMYLIMFYEEFIGKKWNCFNSNKRCQLAYSKYQGKNELTKYIHKKLGISSHYNNNENLKKSFYINNEDKYPRPLIEIPKKYYKNFISYYPFSKCHIKDDKIFVVEKCFNF